MTFSRSPARAVMLSVMATVVAVLTACNLDTKFPSSVGVYGFVTVPTLRTSGVESTRPFGQFLRGTISSVPDARFPNDTCTPTSYAPAQPLTNVQFIDAGTAVTLRAGNSTADMLPVSAGGNANYSIPGDGLMPMTPGDSIVVTIPGSINGFPGGEIRAKTAESFTIPDIQVPAINRGIPLSWTPASDLNSIMLISFRFAGQGSSGDLNSQMLCAFVDNGSDSLPARHATPWVQSVGGLREVVATRLRTNIVSFDGGLAEVIAYYQTSITINP
jgi:hypothetical protein